MQKKKKKKKIYMTRKKGKNKSTLYRRWYRDGEIRKHCKEEVIFICCQSCL